MLLITVTCLLLLICFLANKCSQCACVSFVKFCWWCMLLPNKQLAGRHCTPFYFCTSAAGLSLTPKLIYAGGKQDNMNNDAVFPQISLLRQADSCQLIAQETFICMSNLEGKTRGMQIDRVERGAQFDSGPSGQRCPNTSLDTHCYSDCWCWWLHVHTFSHF